jgi:hypothetical protein
MTASDSEMSETKHSPSETSSKSTEMAFTAEAVRDEMRQRVRDIAALAPEDSRKAALAFAARVLRLPFGRVKCLYYGEARRIDAHEADQIRAYVHAASKMMEARADYERQRREFLAQAHSALVRLAPPPLRGTEVPQDE